MFIWVNSSPVGLTYPPLKPFFQEVKLSNGRRASLGSESEPSLRRTQVDGDLGVVGNDGDLN